MVKVFIDGKEGTTGLRIFDRLSARDDINLLTLNDDERKNSGLRREMINSSEITFLCLPDQAAREAAAFVDNCKTRIIDTSTAHRTQPNWSYGFSELSEKHRVSIIKGNRIAVPGCHASGFISLVYPLIVSGVLSKDYPIVCFSVTGYSGGGKKMIAQYEAAERPEELKSPRQYALAQEHKHLAEMAAVAGLERKPVFAPFVCDYYSGMAVTLYLDKSVFAKSVSLVGLTEYYKDFYGGERLITVCGSPESGFAASNEMARKPDLKIYVMGCDERVTVTAVFDNLLKGASGAAIQNMNLALGIDEYKGVLE